MTSYEPQVIQAFADRLYARTTGAIIVSTLVGVIIGFLVDPFIHQSLPMKLANVLPEWVMAAVLGVMGALQGMERASLLKLQAQTALCQMQIERNTRNSSETQKTAGGGLASGS